MAGPKNSSGGGNKVFMKFSMDNVDTSETRGQFFFEKIEKVNGSWTATDRFNDFEGKLVDLEFGSYKHGEGEQETCKMTFLAEGIYYVISMNMSYMSRGLLNSLISNPEFVSKHDILIHTYMKDDNCRMIVRDPSKEQSDKTGWIGWRFKFEEMPAVKKQKFGGKVISDDSEVNEWMRAWVMHEFENKLEGVQNLPQPSESAQAPTDSLQTPTPAPQQSAPGPQSPPHSAPPAGGPKMPPSTPPSGTPKPGPRNTVFDGNQSDDSDDLPF